MISLAKALWLDAKGDEDDGEKFLIKLPPVDPESCNASQMNCNRARLRSVGNLFSWLDRQRKVTDISKCVNQGQYLYLRRWIKATYQEHYGKVTHQDHYLKATRQEHYVKAKRQEHYLKATHEEHYLKATHQDHYLKATHQEHYLEATHQDQ